MTEAEWLTAAGPDAMQERMLRANVSARRVQLFVAACGDAVWDQLPYEWRTAIEALRRAADGADNRGHKRCLKEHRPLNEWVGWMMRAAGHTRAAHDAAVARARDVFGNPFRPVAFDPAWRTDTATVLARTMYGAREFSAMPILADALEYAGCGNDDILTHCRGSGPHVRGCWVCDLVLGKD